MFWYHCHMKICIYTDGGSRGNPGISGYGLVILDESQNILYQEGKFLGIKTNNEAEYMGLVAALTWIKNNPDNLDISSLSVFADSQLMIRQMQGVYKVKSPNLIELYRTAKHLVSQVCFPVTFTDIRREFNKLADELANQAMDRK